MALLSFLKRAALPPSANEPADAVQLARIRARQRLIGAAVLVVIGVIGFPLVFETQPRPIPVDIPIEVPRREGAPPLVMPAARAPTAPAVSSPMATALSSPVVSASSAPAVAARGAVITESPEDAGREVVAGPAAPRASAVLRPDPKPGARAPATVAIEPAPRPAAGAADADGARVRALLEAKPAAVAADAGHFIVQVGAFADADAARETRLKVEKLGLKTYTQVAATSAGNRIRVRVGPFGTRDEADRAMAKAKGAGLTAVVLTL